MLAIFAYIGASGVGLVVHVVPEGQVLVVGSVPVVGAELVIGPAPNSGACSSPVNQA